MQRLLTSHVMREIIALLTNPSYGYFLALAVVVGDTFLTQCVIRFIRYTEIDWETYMYQVELYLKGERDYSAIAGPTGPLVYPAGHVYIHEVLYKITSGGLDIPLAQQIYGGLYIISLVLSCTIYLQAGGAPNWLLLLLPLSKRLHSVFVLRLFNDCWAVVGAQAAILLLAKGWHSMGSILFSLALSVKMSVLLYMPGLAMILWLRLGIVQAILHLALIPLFQMILGMPFLSVQPLQYLAGAFDLSRVFLFKWTVNWRFLGEGVFLNTTWARALLLGHLLTLLAFAHFKWSRNQGGMLHLMRQSWMRPFAGCEYISASTVTTILLTSNLIGIMFARSLHYQFYSWYAQQIPLLTWKTRYPTILRLCVIGCIEYAWNVFPSTSLSSALLVASNFLLLVGLWTGYSDDHNAQRDLSALKKGD